MLSRNADWTALWTRLPSVQVADGAGVLEHVQFSLLNGDDVVVREQQGRHITLTSDPYSAAEMRALLNTLIKS